MLSNEAKPCYDEALERELNDAKAKLQQNAIGSVIKVHLRKRLRQQARLFCVEASAELSEIFGRTVSPKEFYSELTFWNDSRLFVNLSDESADEKEPKRH